MTDELEPPRPIPDFRIYVDSAHYDAPIDVTHAVMDAYDIAINSMDFGSGFLSTEEVGTLRALGKAIGAKKFDYQYDKCLRCEHERHKHGGPINDQFCFAVTGRFDKNNGGYQQNCQCNGFTSGTDE